jgi:hypothetical protein
MTSAARAFLACFATGWMTWSIALPAQPASTGPLTADTGRFPSPPNTDDQPQPETIDPDDGAPFVARVTAYLLSPEAGVAGLLFADGRELHVPPSLGRRLVDLVKPGQYVQVGARTHSAEGPPKLPTITAQDTGQSIDGSAQVNDGPPPPRDNQGTALIAMTVAGTVAQSLHGPRGEKNGVRLTSGVQVSFPPRVALEGGPRLAPGRQIKVEGFGRSSEFGTAVQATSITSPGEPALQVYDRNRPR